ncbi:MAG: TCP-1/cpn60 chaperonin family protein, partial [bacterium]|nr:TCP-1/cpn60 chaperonin family protein [bacterium]
VVAGGGVALIKASQKVGEWFKNEKAKGPSTSSGRARESMTKEFEVGFNIVLKALEAPLKQIAINAGKDDGSVIVEHVRNGKGNAGYDALKDEMVPDMIASGIIDPVKVTRSGVQNAASAAAVLLTTEAAIADEPKEEKEGPAMGGGMPGGMDY